MNKLYKAKKGEYGNVIVIKNNGNEYAFRSPTCEEYSKYLMIKDVDPVAANYFLVFHLNITNNELNTIPPDVVVSVLDFCDKIFSVMSIELYEKSKLKKFEPDPIMVLLFKLQIAYNIPMSYSSKLTPNELMHLIRIAEEITGYSFFDGEQTNPQSNVESSKIAEAYDKVLTKIQSMRDKPE